MLSKTTDLLERYIFEIKRYPLLSREEESRLAIRWRDYQDTKAAHDLVTSNLLFVVKIAYEYKSYNFPMMDLIQEGNIGLMHAVQFFDPRKGYRLISYAVYWIRNYIQKYIRRFMKIIKFNETRDFRRLFFKLKAVKDKQLLQGLSGRSALEKVAEDLSVSKESVEEVAAYLQCRAIVKAQDRELAYYDDIDSEIDKADKMAKVENALQDLSDKERYIVEQRYLKNDLIMPDIAKELGVSKQRVFQIERRALAKLRESLKV